MDWINDIKDPFVNELLWAVISPPILDSKTFDNFPLSPHAWWIEKAQSNKDLFISLESDPTPLIDWIAEKAGSAPLGKRFECLIQFFLTYALDITLLAHNIQIFEQQETIGEIDFIIQESPKDSPTHLEVACKFYLQTSNSHSWTSFVGPNGKDSLHEKIEKTKRQIQLSQTTHFQKQMPQFKNSVLQAQALIKGYLFHHFRRIQNSKRPKNAFKNYNAGWYAFASEIDTVIPNNSFWVILERKAWLNPELQDEEGIIDSKTLRSYALSHFEHSLKALAIAQVMPTESTFVQLNRGFIVHNKWPNLK